MRRFKFTIGVTAGLMMIATAAFAGISNFTPTGLQEVTEFPHTQDVSVTFSNSPDLCQTGQMDWRLWVLGTDGTTILADDDGSYVTAGTPPTCAASTSQVETLTGVVFPTAGVYTLRATLKTAGNQAVNDDETETVNFQLEQTIVVDYPAAPAVANKLLKDAGESNLIGKGKNQTNLIEEVAEYMGPGTDFDGVSKSDVAAYETAVKTFLNNYPGINL